LVWVAVELGALTLTAPVLLFLSDKNVPVALAAVGVLVAVRIGAYRHYPHSFWCGATPAVTALLAMALVGTAVSADQSLSVRRMFGLVFSAAALLSTEGVGRAAGTLGPTIVAWVLVAQGVGIALIGILFGDMGGGEPELLANVVRVVQRGVLGQRSAAVINPNEVAGILVIILPLAVALAGSSGVSWLARAIGGLAAASMAAVTLLTFSRSGLAGVVAASLAMSAAWRPARTFRALLLLAGVAFGSAAVHRVGSQVWGWQLPDLQGMPDLADRLELWFRAIYMIQDFPFTGIGLNTFPLVTERLYPLFISGPEIRFPHAHNLFLQTGVDYGVPGLMAFLWMLAIVGRQWTGTCRVLRSWRSVRADASGARELGVLRAILIGLGAGLLGHFVYGLTDAVALGARPGYILWMAIGAISVSHGAVLRRIAPEGSHVGALGAMPSWSVARV
jgi:putative inorganic carbon (hco3(-)) transporter